MGRDAFALTLKGYHSSGLSLPAEDTSFVFMCPAHVEGDVVAAAGRRATGRAAPVARRHSGRRVVQRFGRGAD